ILFQPNLGGPVPPTRQFEHPSHERFEAVTGGSEIVRSGREIEEPKRSVARGDFCKAGPDLDMVESHVASAESQAPFSANHTFQNRGGCGALTRDALALST